MKHKTIKELFEAKSNLLGAWVSTDDQALQTQLFQLYDAVNDILAARGIDPFSYYTIDTPYGKIPRWSMLLSNELERRG